MLALPIFPGRHQPSIVGRNELNYRVRNGNGWTLVLISTNYRYPVFPENKHTIHFSLALVKLLEPNFQTSEAFENQKGKATERLNFRIYAEAIVAEHVPTKSWRLCGSLVLPGVFPYRWIFNCEGS